MLRWGMELGGRGWGLWSFLDPSFVGGLLRDGEEGANMGQDEGVLDAELGWGN